MQGRVEASGKSHCGGKLYRFVQACSMTGIQSCCRSQVRGPFFKLEGSGGESKLPQTVNPSAQRQSA